ncbi:hypothetical protein ABE28_016550 [Peribacillus muralis]|uniref:Uncharacterized protein n=1 Tax=Peribacillus muralis TaxID=264697 RepID=A0A1B3XRY1_9BACI|nr:hypothetical protein ABE28_016550 [Peribacillus muralis]
MNVRLVELNGCVPVPVTKTENGYRPFEVRMETHAKKGGTVEWLIKPFHPFNLQRQVHLGCEGFFVCAKS